GKVVGYVVIADKIKGTSKKAINELQQKGIEVIMLTGDNHDTAKAVAAELNLADFKAEMLPQDKLEVVEKLHAEGKKVAMAGDGLKAVSASSLRDVCSEIGTGSGGAIDSGLTMLIKPGSPSLLTASHLPAPVMPVIKPRL